MLIALDARQGDWEPVPRRNTDGWLDAAANDNEDARPIAGCEGPPRFAWLDKVTHDRWMLAWRALWARFTDPTGVERNELARRAMRRITIRRSDARWPSVWLRLMAWTVARERRDVLPELCAAAMSWLREQPAHPSWPTVWCELKLHEARLAHPLVGLDALLSLRSEGRDAGLPPPRSSNASLEGPGVVALASLSDERLCSFVREWAETEFVRAVIVEARPGGYLIDVGTQTFVPSSQTWMLPGEAVEVRVRSFGCSDGLARVGAIRNVFNAIDDTVRVGDDEDATVICHHGQGLMVRFRGFCGVVAESEIARRGLCGLLPGERVRVTVLELRRRSAVLSLVASTSA